MSTEESLSIQKTEHEEIISIQDKEEIISMPTKESLSIQKTLDSIRPDPKPIRHQKDVAPQDDTIQNVIQQMLLYKMRSNKCCSKECAPTDVAKPQMLF